MYRPQKLIMQQIYDKIWEQKIVYKPSNQTLSNIFHIFLPTPRKKIDSGYATTYGSFKLLFFPIYGLYFLFEKFALGKTEKVFCVL